MTAIRVLGEAQVRELISPAEALTGTRAAFVRLYRHEACVPEILEMLLPHNGGEAHGKGAYVHGNSYFTVKVATGFATNRELGLPESSGLSLVFDAGTGFAKIVLFDNGYLTQLRTGSAGALAADLLAREDARTVAIVGAGLQARYQLESLLLVRPIDRVIVTSRTIENAQRFATEMTAQHGVRVEVIATIPEAVRSADIVVTTTPATTPIVSADWIRQGTHVTAVGSDFPGKQELDVELLARAVVVADDLPPGKPHGEIPHAVAAGVLDRDAVMSLGGIASGEQIGRSSEQDITVADLTGVGVQDAAVAAIVADRALSEGAGLYFDPQGEAGG